MIRLGKSELEVSRITLGTWVFAGGKLWGNQDVAASVATVHAALDGGINCFDSAPAYGGGEAERVLGLALEGRRDKAVIATKVSTGEQSREALLESCEASLKRLKTDYIDLMQVHWPSPDVPFEETIGTFEELKSQGKVRYFGVCNFSNIDIRKWLSAGGEFISNQLPYSLLTRAIEYEIIPECEEHGIVTLPYSSLMQGLLTGKFRNGDEVPEGRARSRHFRGDRPLSRHGESGCEDETFTAIERIREISVGFGQPMEAVALAWVLAQPTVASAIMGARNVAQLEANLKGMNIELSSEVLKDLNAATDEVKELLGRNPDIWESPGRYSLK
jgi:aryl-alcohol dehydrogenase-like predicted oxidoreductase